MATRVPRMSNTYPPDLEQFVEEELASGKYKNEAELVIDALKVLRELKSRHQQLRTEIHNAILQAERGEVILLDTEATKAEGRRRLANRD